jgi:hypothetical protein
MSCRKEWNKEFLDKHLTAKFLNGDLKKRREDVLLEREKSMLPATQPFVEDQLRKVRIGKQVEELNQKIHELIAQKNALFREQYNTNSISNDIGRRDFIRACPVNGCKGYLSSQWKCGLCETWTCSDCHETKGKNKDTPHTCKPENVETAKLLSKDSKPCPKCGAMCTKVDGCNQVFAMCCGTTFDWTTGRVETGTIHAPDYFRWLQRNGRAIPRNPIDVPCGGLPNFVNVRVVCQRYHPEAAKDYENKYRLITHIDRVELPIYNVGEQGEGVNRDLRIKYMMNEVNEEAFKRLIQQREKARLKKREVYNVLSTVNLAGIDIFHRINQCLDKPSLEKIQQEFNELHEYCNASMQSISRRYKCVTPRISDGWVSIKTSKI